MVHTDYLDKILNVQTLIGCVAVAKDRLKHYNFDAIAVTGYSGTVFGGALSVALAKPLIIVRKDVVRKDVDLGENSHSSQLVEGETDIRTYVFVDDFIFSGSTKERVIEKITEFNGAICVGTYMYKFDDLIEIVESPLMS